MDAHNFYADLYTLTFTFCLIQNHAVKKLTSQKFFYWLENSKTGLAEVTDSNPVEV